MAIGALERLFDDITNGMRLPKLNRTAIVGCYPVCSAMIVALLVGAGTTYQKRESDLCAMDTMIVVDASLCLCVGTYAQMTESQGFSVVNQAQHPPAGLGLGKQARTLCTSITVSYQKRTVTVAVAYSSESRRL
jgi:hypothetical protein